MPSVAASMISSMFNAAWIALRTIRLSVGGCWVIRVGDLDPPMQQGDQADILVVLQSGSRFGRNVLDAL